MKPGSLVRLKKPFLYRGWDFGGREGVILSLESYVMVSLYEFPEGVKCLRYEIEEVTEEKEERLFFDNLAPEED